MPQTETQLEGFTPVDLYQRRRENHHTPRRRQVSETAFLYGLAITYWLLQHTLADVGRQAGGVVRFTRPAVPHIRFEYLAAGFMAFGLAPDDRSLRVVYCDQYRRAAVVRLYLSANCLDSCIHVDRTENRGVPTPAHST